MRSFREWRANHKVGPYVDLRPLGLDEVTELADYMAFSSDKILSSDGHEMHLRSGLYLVTDDQRAVIARALGHTKWLYEDIWSQMDIRVVSAVWSAIAHSI